MKYCEIPSSLARRSAKTFEKRGILDSMKPWEICRIEWIFEAFTCEVVMSMFRSSCRLRLGRAGSSCRSHLLVHRFLICIQSMKSVLVKPRTSFEGLVSNFLDLRGPNDQFYFTCWHNISAGFLEFLPCCLRTKDLAKHGYKASGRAYGRLFCWEYWLSQNRLLSSGKMERLRGNVAVAMMTTSHHLVRIACIWSPLNLFRWLRQADDNREFLPGLDYLVLV